MKSDEDETERVKRQFASWFKACCRRNLSMAAVLHMTMPFPWIRSRQVLSGPGHILNRFSGTAATSRPSGSDADGMKSMIQHTLDTSIQTHQPPDLDAMVKVLVAVEKLTNFSTVIQIALSARSTHRRVFFDTLKSEYMKCWWHWYNRPNDAQSRAEKVIVIAAYPDQYYGTFGAHLVQHCQDWMAKGAPDRSIHLKREFGEIPSSDEISKFQTG